MQKQKQKIKFNADEVWRKIKASDRGHVDEYNQAESSEVDEDNQSGNALRRKKEHSETLYDSDKMSCHYCMFVLSNMRRRVKTG